MAAAASAGWATAQRPMREGLLVALDVGAVDLDGAQQRLLAERHQAGLPGGAEHQHVGVDRVAEQPLGQPGGVEHAQGVLAEPGAQRQRQPVGRQLEAAVAGEVAGDDLVGVDDRAGAAAGHEAEGLGAGGGDEVAADQRVGLADRDADRRDVGRASRRCGSGCAPRRPSGRGRPSPSRRRPCPRGAPPWRSARRR